VPAVPLFDAYVFVDWGAAKVPRKGKDSIWIGQGSWNRGHFETSPPENPSTRDEATRRIEDLLNQHRQTGHRVLVGFDFSYGYPQGFARAMGIRNASPWRGVWQYFGTRVHDGPDNANNRFEVAAEINRQLSPPTDGPFWGRPKHLALPNLAATKPTFPFPVGETELAQFRTVDRHLLDNRKQPKSVWQLFGAGAVGSQALTGIPRLEQLRSAVGLSSCSLAWPFETGWDVPPRTVHPLILHAEIWPGAVPMDVRPPEVRDAGQVRGLVEWCANLDRLGRLDALFGRPHGLSAEEDHRVRSEEGWLLMPVEEQLCLAASTMACKQRQTRKQASSESLV